RLSLFRLKPGLYQITHVLGKPTKACREGNLELVQIPARFACRPERNAQASKDRTRGWRRNAGAFRCPGNISAPRFPAFMKTKFKLFVGAFALGLIAPSWGAPQGNLENFSALLQIPAGGASPALGFVVSAATPFLIR